MFYLYQITCKVTGDFYIGQTINFKKRMREHRNHPKRSNIRLTRAIEKYGVENFSFDIIEIWSTQEEVLEAEEFRISKAKNEGKTLYNIAKGGHYIPIICNENHAQYGTKHSPERILKNSLSHIGLQAGEKHPHCKYSNELILKIRDDYDNNGMFQTALSKKYNIPSSTIDKIVRRDRRKDI